LKSKIFLDVQAVLARMNVRGGNVFNHRWKWLFTWEGQVDRLHYFLSGAILVALKYAIDWSVAARSGEPWHVWNYFLPALDTSFYALGIRQPKLYLTLWAIAIPFFWIGIALTLRRLRDAGKSSLWIFLFFVPLANLGMFLWLSFAPPSAASTGSETPAPSRDLAQRKHSGAILGFSLSVILGLALVAFSARALMQYAWGLFLGVPFLTGFVASWFLNSEVVRSKWATVKVCTLTTFVIGLGLFGFGYEGLFCLLMALPLALPFSFAGGLVAQEVLRRQTRRNLPTFAASLAILPLVMLGEHAARLEPPVISVTTSVIIKAPVEVVWKNVIAFPPLKPPTEWLFRAGIAYPTSAQIVGSGPGATRYCRFSTGDFVEPITTWDENRLLAFDVSAQPQAMRELSPWRITPPHLEQNYMRSRHGQFRLIVLDKGRTLLEGTTWYQNYFWPQAYWREWSDAIVHQIHKRVLRHVKLQAEADNAALQNKIDAQCLR